MLDSNFARWVFASVSDFVNSQKGDYELWIEGQESLAIDELDAYAELYVGGPTYIEKSKDYFIHDLDVRIAIAVKKDYRDGHLAHRIKGHFQSVLASGPINVFKYGDNPTTDSGDYIGCFVLRDDVAKAIDGFDFGQISTDVRFVRATVEGFYRMENT